MSKPQWLKNYEQHAEFVVSIPDFCTECIYFGRFVKRTKHRGVEWVDVFDCDIHPNCLNTKYSICCEDFTCEELV